MTQEEFDRAPKLNQILYDTTGMLVINHSDIKESMEKYAEWYYNHKLSERQTDIVQFGVWLCGHDKLTIEQMYNDFTKRKQREDV